jgi:hypothetical protein
VRISNKVSAVVIRRRFFKLRKHFTRLGQMYGRMRGAEIMLRAVKWEAEQMLDSLPWWAFILRRLGWSVIQDWQICEHDYDGCVRIHTSGMLTKESAEELMKCSRKRYTKPHVPYESIIPYGQGLWIRRSIEVWRDVG